MYRGTGPAHVAGQQRTVEQWRNQVLESLRSCARDDGNRREVNSRGIQFPFLEMSEAFLKPIVARIESIDGPFNGYYTVQYLRESDLPISGDSWAALQQGAAASSYDIFEAAIPAVLAEYASGPYLSFADPQVFRAITESLGRANNWPRNAAGEQAQAENVELTQRARLIASILQGKDAFQIYGGHPGEAKRLMTFPASGLNGLTIEKLREIESAVLDLRRQRGQTREERQAELADRARNTRGYDNQPQRTELDRPIEIADGAGRHYQSASDAGGHAAPGRMDRMPTASTNPSADRLFTNPETGAPWTAKQIKALMGGGEKERALFKLMMRTDLERTNQLLNSK